jgi:adenylosuccinate lyase
MSAPTASTIERLDTIYQGFSKQDALEVKRIERTTNHDVKAVEYFIKNKLESSEETASLKELVHFCCTSEDINNLAYARMLRDSLATVIVPGIEKLLTTLSQLSISNAKTPLLALTHGQAATPTTFGREMAVFIDRVAGQLSILKSTKIRGKLNGATGSFNAHLVAFPEIAWESVSRSFVEDQIGVTYQPVSTQIECHDYIGELSDCMSRMSTILIGFSRDMWSYISRHVLKLRAVPGETGSSTMPHKVNPIDFENAEGNLGISVALFNHFSSKLLISRLQRDLSDSTVLRNLGLAFAHFLISIDSLIRGIGKVEVNETACNAELDANFSIVAEAVQTVMRKHALVNPYERLKTFTRGAEVSKQSMKEFIESLRTELPQEEVEKLLQLTPQTYLGSAEEIARKYGQFPRM